MRNSAILAFWLGLASCFAVPAYSQPYTVVDTFAGSGRLYFTWGGGPATSAPLVSPAGVAADTLGNVYVADGYFDQVFKISPQGQISVFAGTGKAAQKGDGVPAASIGFTSPWGVATDSAGNVYITDRGAHLVYLVDPNGIATIFAGTGGHEFAGDNGPAKSAQLNTPLGIAVGPRGDVFIAENQGNRIRKVDKNGIITTFAGTGALDGVLEGVPATRSAAPLPSGVAVDPAGNVYYAESGEGRVRKIDTNNVVRTIAGTGAPGYSGDHGPALSAQLSGPAMLALDTGGNLYVADFTNQRVRQISPQGVIQTVAGTGTAGYNGDGMLGELAQVAEPNGVAVDSARNLYITEAAGRRVRKITPDGVIHTAVGTGVTIPLGDGGPARSANLLSVVGVISDGAGTFYVTDLGNDCVRKITPDGKISTVAGTGIPGYNGDRRLAVTAHLNSPRGLALDAQGNLYIAEEDSHRVRKVTPDGMIATVAGTGTAGYNGDGRQATTAMLYTPRGLAVDGKGNLYIADLNNYRVRKVGTDGMIATVAGNGQWDFYGDGGPATAAALRWPFGVALDSAGNLYISDSYNFRIRKVSASDGTITTVAGTDHAGYSGDGGPATQAALDRPDDISIDAQGNLYISDVLNHVLRKVDSKGIITTLVGGGTSVPEQDGILASAVVLRTTGSVWVHSDGTIYLPDAGVARLLKVRSGQIARESVVNAASFVGGAVAPGEIVTIYGDQLGPQQLVKAVLAAEDRYLPKEISDVRVFFDDGSAPLVWVSSGAVSAIVPYAVGGKTTTRLKVVWQGKSTNEVDVPVAAAMPGIFTMGPGTGPGVVFNQDATLNSTSNPAGLDSIVVFFATGEGETSPAGVDGKLAMDVYPKPVQDVEVKIGGATAELLYQAAIPYQPAGLMQVNARVPRNITPGDAVLVELFVGGKASQPGVALAVR